MSWRGPREHAGETDAEERSLRGMIRRAMVGLTSAGGVAAGIWQVLGAKLDGKRTGTIAEVWQGIGFASRPRAGRGEAIVIAVGAAGNASGGAPAIVATRDEALRQLAAGALGEDETAIFTSKAIIVIKADGTAEIRSLGGTAQRLVTETDFAAFRAWALAHFHTDPVSGFTGVATVTPPVPVYTGVLRGE